jgi:type IV fimbrial biogenesis protein FimT
MKHARGFTLIELMAAILVLGILLGFAIPNFREMTRNNRVTATQNELLTALALARNEALHQGTTVSICASSDGSTCTSSGTAPFDWKPGWIVFRDGGTAGTVDGTDAVLQQWGGLDGETMASSPTTFVTFSGTGMQTPIATKTFTIWAKTCTGAKARLLSIGPIGSVTTTQTNCP